MSTTPTPFPEPGPNDVWGGQLIQATKDLVSTSAGGSGSAPTYLGEATFHDAGAEQSSVSLDLAGTVPVGATVVVMFVALNGWDDPRRGVPSSLVGLGGTWSAPADGIRFGGLGQRMYVCEGCNGTDQIITGSMQNTRWVCSVLVFDAGTVIASASGQTSTNPYDNVLSAAGGPRCTGVAAFGAYPGAPFAGLHNGDLPDAWTLIADNDYSPGGHIAAAYHEDVGDTAAHGVHSTTDNSGGYLVVLQAPLGHEAGGAGGSRKAIALENGWTNFGSGNPDAHYEKTAGLVTAGGCVAGGAQGSVLFTFEDGYKPRPGDCPKPIVVNGDTRPSVLQINADGTVTAAIVSSNFVYLDGIVFPAGG